MKIVGCTRVKNGGRWMREHLESVLAVCDEVVVLDNHSTDDTVNICMDFAQVSVVVNPSVLLNEAGDKNYLVQEVKRLCSPDWILFLDADEVLLDPGGLLTNINSGRASAYQVHIWSCWNDPTQVRVDGIYGRCWRASCFKVAASNCKWVERSTQGPNLHCNNIPQDLNGFDRRCEPEVRVRHYGYMLKEDRIRKYHWYIDIDPHGLYLKGEDYYRHSVQGDMPEFPADAKYMHGGPLSIVPFPEVHF